MTYGIRLRQPSSLPAPALLSPVPHLPRALKLQVLRPRPVHVEIVQFGCGHVVILGRRARVPSD